MPTRLKNLFEKFVDINKDGSLDINKQKYADYMLTKGIRILVSNIVSDPIEAWKAYHDRNEVEYAFKYYKQRIGGKRMRIGSENTLDGKVFLQFLATSIAIMFRKRMESAADILSELGLAYDSDPVVIAKLDTIHEINFKFGSYPTEIAGGLKKLLEKMGIALPNSYRNEIYPEDEIEEYEQGRNYKSDLDKLS